MAPRRPARALATALLLLATARPAAAGCTAQSVSGADVRSDCAAIRAFYYGLGLRPTTWAANVQNGDSYCAYSGVACDGNNRIVGLSLSGAGLPTIPIPGIIGNLLMLQTIDLSFNNFTGQIPQCAPPARPPPRPAAPRAPPPAQFRLDGATLDELPRPSPPRPQVPRPPAEPPVAQPAEQLPAGPSAPPPLPPRTPSPFHPPPSLSRPRHPAASPHLPASSCPPPPAATAAQGNVPAALGLCAALQTVILDNNQIGGPLPATLGLAPALQQFSAQNNQLTGPLPPALGISATLAQLQLNNNMIDGAPRPLAERLSALLSPGLRLSRA